MPLLSILTDAQLAQRDASRRLYFVSAGCLYHPRAHLVLDDDPTARIALEQSAEAALQFAALSREEAAAFRERAVAATKVVRTNSGYAFRQPNRPPRRQRRQRRQLAPLFLRGALAIVALSAIASGLHVANEGISDGRQGAEFDLLGIAAGGGLALLGVGLFWACCIRTQSRDWFS